MAAAVAAITIGLAIDEQVPKGSTLSIGTLSMMFASGTLVMTILVGSTMNELGAAPKVHLSIAPMQTCWPISFPSAGYESDRKAPAQQSDYP
jgi:hypothetical protein